MANQQQPKPNKDVRRIIAVDRIDYSKGIIERFDAYAQFLQTFTEYQAQVQLYQIACPSRLDLETYHHLHEQVQQRVKHINDRLLFKGWQPIICNESVLPHKTVMQKLANSDICWVNSLKDGMNLVAKEYIAAQHPDNPGVLMLSKFAGAAAQMQEAVIVDPYDEQSLIAGLITALTMPLAERQRRYQVLIDGLKSQNLYDWQQQFLQDLYAQQKIDH